MVYIFQSQSSHLHYSTLYKIQKRIDNLPVLDTKNRKNLYAAMNSQCVSSHHPEAKVPEKPVVGTATLSLKLPAEH